MTEKSIRFEELCPEHWPAVERLFGPNGACGGCWCMCWRMDSYKTWYENRGAPSKEAFKKLVQSGKAHGVLAFAQGQAVGWCSFGPRSDFPVLQQSKAYKRDDIENVWSVTCFFIHRKWRGKGLSGMLLKEAIGIMKKRGVKVVEGYPVTTTRDGRKLVASMAWKGPLKLFEKQGFSTVQVINPLRPLVRLGLQKRRQLKK
jgi:GNAT superfamily N-acetyltransferase